MTITGYASSALEHFVWERKYEPGGVSAVKAIQRAYEAGVEVKDIDASNIDELNTLSIPDAAKTDMSCAITQYDQTVKTPVDEVTILDSAQQTVWSGVGYFVQDKDTAEGRFEIVPAGVSGGWYRNQEAAKGQKAALLVYQVFAGRWPGQGMTERQLRKVCYVAAKGLYTLGYPSFICWCLSTTKIKELIKDETFRIFLIAARAYVDTSVYLGQGFAECGYYEENPELSVSDVVGLGLDDDQYQLVIFFCCFQARTGQWAQAFKIDYENKYNEEAFLGNVDSPYISDMITDCNNFFTSLCVGDTIKAASETTQEMFQPPYGGLTPMTVPLSVGDFSVLFQ